MPVRPRVARGIIPSLAVNNEFGTKVALASVNTRGLYNLNKSRGWYAADALTTSTVYKRARKFVDTRSVALTVPNHTDFNGGEGVSTTWAGWVKLTSIPIAANNGILDKFSVDEEFPGIYITPAGAFRYLAVEANGAAATTPNGAATTDTWYFIVAEFNGSTHLTSITINLGTTYTKTGTNPLLTGTSPLIFGVSDGDYLDGALSGWGFWRRLLTVEEKAFLYNNGNGRFFFELSNTIKSSLKGWWEFDEADGGSFDYSGNGHLAALSVLTNPGVDGTFGPTTQATATLASVTSLSVNSLTLSQATSGNQPSLTKSADGLNVFFFNATDANFFNGTFGVTPANDTTFVLARQGRFNSQGISDPSYFTYDVTNGYNNEIRLSASSVQTTIGTSLGDDGSNSARYVISGTAQAFDTFVITRQETGGTEVTDGFLRVNGNPETNRGGTATNPQYSQAFLVGAFTSPPDSSSCFGGQIGELILLPGSLTYDEITELEQYLGKRASVIVSY